MFLCPSRNILQYTDRGTLKWACSETLGAALMDRRELVRDMVLETRQMLRDDGWAVEKEKDMDNPKGRSVSVKIRVHKDLRYVPPQSGMRAKTETSLGRQWTS